VGVPPVQRSHTGLRLLCEVFSSLNVTKGGLTTGSSLNADSCDRRMTADQSWPLGEAWLVLYIFKARQDIVRQ
jgi:hypothetical protein